jgi:iron complex outermembrane receptor protein
MTLVKVAASLLATTWVTVAAAQTPPAAGTSMENQEAPAVQPDAPAATAEAPAVAPAEHADAAAAPASADTATAGDVEEIIVTAQRRSERLVDVPISIASISSDELERAGSESIENINKLVPGIYMQRDVYGVTPTVRGIGSTLNSTSGESNVSLYADGVYLPFRATNIFDLASVSNIQVLKGPQGTLFGRNATGGAILISTLDPSFTPAARLRASYERFDQVRTSGYVNVPITDQIAANAAISYRHSDGYIHDERTNDLVNEGEDYSGRFKVLVQPSDSLSVVLTAYLSRFDDPTGSSYQSIAPPPFYSMPGIDANSGPIANDRYHRSHNIEDVVKTQSDLYSATVKWDAGFGDVQSITSSQQGTLQSVNDLDATYQTLVPGVNARTGFKTKADVVTQEFNLTSKPGSTFDYVTGLYYFDSRGGLPYFMINEEPRFKNKGRTQAGSAYFDGNYHLGSLVLIGGLRYTHEERHTNTTFLPEGSGSNIDDATDNVWTPRVGARYEITSASNVYATYTRGYKAGVFDATSPTGNDVSPEYVNAFEVGFKTSAAKYTLNTALYYYDFKDTQVNAVFSNGGEIYQQLFNVPKSEIYGFDVDGTYRFSNAFDVRTSLAFTHARYKDFKNAPDYVIDPTDPNTGGLFYSSRSVDVGGAHMVRAPEWSANTALNYHTQVWSGARLDASLSGAYTSRVYFNFSNSLDQSGYFLVDSKVNLAFNDHLSMSIFGRNLTDEIYYSSATQSSLATAVTYGMPRTYGVSFEYNF